MNNFTCASFIFFLVFFTNQALCIVVLNIEDHIDNENVLNEIWRTKNIQFDGSGEKLSEIEKEIINLDGESISKILSQPQIMAIDNFALPVFLDRKINISGVGGFEGLAYSKFYPISDFAGIKVNTYKRGRENGIFSVAIIYFRIDNDFTPIRTIDDFEKRLEWDKDKLNKLLKWYENKLSE